MPDLSTILLRPIPDHSAARARKDTFRDYPLKNDGLHNAEPLIDISLYGIAGQSYYSRPNRVTTDPVPGVSAAIRLRQSIVVKLTALNYAVQQSTEVEALLGGKVELYVNEGFRPANLQTDLYQSAFPKLIHQEHPDYSSEQIEERRDELIAAPSDAISPSPHESGAALDLCLRYLQPELHYIPGSEVKMWYKRQSTGLEAGPDCFEQLTKLTKLEQRIRDNRRVFYWIMRGALNDDSGFVCNPTEWWHWSYGDQMWATLTDAPVAFYAAARMD